MLLNCKFCGGELEITEGASITTCKYCHTSQTLPKTKNEERHNLFNRANSLRRRCDFDKAEAAFEKIIEADGCESEAYWGLVLCKYGIEYVEDPATGKMIPTCHRASFDSVIADEDYKSALEYAEKDSRILYEEQAKEIDRIQKDILALAQKEESYDVFICYKETDENGKRTRDSAIANDIYYQLNDAGFKVFFAAITLEGKLGQDYEPIIFAALNSAKVMLVVGTKPEYFNAVWVKNEWSRFLKIIRKDHKKLLIPCYRYMDAYELPDEFAHLQAQDMEKIGFVNDLVRGIKKVMDGFKKKPEVIVEKTETVIKEKETLVKEPVINSTTIIREQGGDTVASGNGVNVSALLRRAFIFLEDGDFESADEYCEKVLDMAPENAEAYLGKLMVELKVKNRELLSYCKQPFSENKNYKNALRFASADYKKVIEGYNNAVVQRIEDEQKEAAYTRCVELMKSHNYDEAVVQFQKISSYKDSKQKIDECKQLKETERLEGIYANAVKLMKSHSYDEAVKQFQKISSYKDSKQKAVDCKQLKETERCEKIYTEAVQLLKACKYDEASALFKTIQTYSDSENQIAVCAEKKENATKESVYSQAILRVVPEKASEFAIQKSIEDLQSIPGYKDSDEQVKTLTARLEKLYEDKKIAKEQEKIRLEKERIEREAEAQLVSAMGAEFSTEFPEDGANCWNSGP